MKIRYASVIEYESLKPEILLCPTRSIFESFISPQITAAAQIGFLSDAFQMPAVLIAEVSLKKLII